MKNKAAIEKLREDENYYGLAVTFILQY